MTYNLEDSYWLGSTWVYPLLRGVSLLRYLLPCQHRCPGLTHSPENVEFRGLGVLGRSRGAIGKA